MGNKRADSLLKEIKLLKELMKESEPGVASELRKELVLLVAKVNRLLCSGEVKVD
jgi:hypothetical protein